MDINRGTDPPQTFDDDPMRRMPASMRLYRELEDAFPTIREAAIKALMKSERVTEDTYEADELENRKSHVKSAGLHQSIPLKIAGSDNVLFKSIDEPNRAIEKIDESDYSIEVELFRDGSPYVPDDMIEQFVNSPRFVIKVPLEGRPFIALDEDLYHNPDPDESGIRGTLRAYQEKLRRENREPRYLTDDEAQALIDILPQLQIDPDTNLENNINIF